MKKALSILAGFIAMPMVAFAQVPQLAATQAIAEETIPLRDPATGEHRQFTLQDVKNPKTLIEMLPKLEGVTSIFNAYMDKGYAPFHAYLLTNADIMVILQEISPQAQISPQVDARIKQIRDLYEHKQ